MLVHADKADSVLVKPELRQLLVCGDASAFPRPHTQVWNRCGNWTPCKRVCACLGDRGDACTHLPAFALLLIHFG